MKNEKVTDPENKLGFGNFLRRKIPRLYGSAVDVAKLY
jgi:hypothetical protein